MDDAGEVRLGERVGNLRGERQRPPRIDRMAANRSAQRLTRHVLRREEQPALVFAGFEHRGDARMGQRRRLAGVFDEPGVPLGVGEQFLPYDPERDGPSMPRVAGPIQLADAAGANPIEDLVVSDGLEH